MTVEVRQLIINSEVSSSAGKGEQSSEPPEDAHPDQGTAQRFAWADVRGLMRRIEREQER